VNFLNYLKTYYPHAPILQRRRYFKIIYTATMGHEDCIEFINETCLRHHGLSDQEVTQILKDLNLLPLVIIIGEKIKID
jgi:hypothetical protein